MLEIEMKFPAPDFMELESKLVGWQARPEPPIEEADHYHNAPDRDFRNTGEAFRLRRIADQSFITYKGPKLPGLVKTRPEIEVALAEGLEPAEDFLRILQHLGYRPVAVVKKRRRIWHLARGGFALQVCLDDVEYVGRFVEVEILAAPSQREDAEKVLQEVAQALGLAEPEKRSYLEMFMSKLGRTD